MNYQTIVDEIKRRLKWKQDIIAERSSQWTPTLEAQFERWENNICNQIDQWSWAELDKDPEGRDVDSILSGVFLSLESETIRTFVRENLIGRRKLARVAKHSR